MQSRKMTRLAKRSAERGTAPACQGQVLVLFMICILSGWTVALADLSVKAFVDQTRVYEGQKLTLSVELSGSDADKAPDPEAPDLGFARFLGKGTSTNMQIINARISSSRTVQFYYTAQQSGDFVIPGITIRLDGTDYATDPIPIEVVKGPAGSPTARSASNDGSLSRSDLFLRADVSKRKVYTGEPVILTYRIFTRVSVGRYGVSRQPDRSGFWVEDLLDPKRQVETTTEILDGQRYTVAVIQRLALFPAAPGRKTLSPLEIECEVRVRRTRRSLFDDFFEDPFGRTSTYSVQSDPVEIEVQPLPERGKPPGFSGAVGSFSLTGEIHPTTVNVNDVVTLRLKLEGSGNIRTLSNPTVSASPALELYDPEVSETIRPVGDKIRGTRTYEFVLVPRAAGTHRIEPIQFSYFDPADETYKTTGLDEIVIRADPSLTAGNGVPGAPPQVKQDVRLLAQEIRFIKLSPGSFRSSNLVFYRSLWFWAALVLPPLVLAGAKMFRARADRLRGDVAYARDRRAAGMAKKRLAEARRLLAARTHREFYAESGRALRGFIADKLNLAEAGLMSEALNRQLLEAGVSPPLVEEFLDCLQQSDLRHFAPVGSTEVEMSDFLRQAEKVITRLHKELSR